MGQPSPATVLLYAADADRSWRERVLTQLRPLVRDTLITLWDGSQLDLAYGEDRKTDLLRPIAEARCAVLLLSPDFFNSDELVEVVLPALAARGAALTILPVLVRPVNVRQSPIVAGHKQLPASGQFLTLLGDGDRDLALLEVEQAIHQILGDAPSPSLPHRPSAPAQVPAQEWTALRESALVVRQQTEQIRLYKLLHDQLHSLQFHVYNAIAKDAGSFATDPQTRDLFGEYEYNLANLLAAVRGIARTSDGQPMPLPWLDDLGAAHGALKAALSADPQNGARSLRQSMHLMKRVLTVRPAEVNQALVDAASGLRISDLTRSSSLTRRARLAERLAGLGALKERLTKLVACHTQWQNIEVELGLVESSLEPDTVQLEVSFPWLKQHISPLCEGAEEWATGLVGLLGNLETSLATSDSPSQRSQFKRLRRLASNRFFQVDVDLKGLCNDLQNAAVQLQEELTAAIAAQQQVTA